MDVKTAETRTVDGREVPPPGTWKIDPSHSEVQFFVRHMMISKVRGRFRKFEGAVRAMAGFAVHVADQECYQAAGLPGRPYGELLPSEEPRLSMATRVPAGVVGVISPFNVPLILSIRSVAPALALGNAVILKPDPRTAVTGGSRSAGCSRRPGCRPASCR